jgi:hypothetical protein
LTRSPVRIGECRPRAFMYGHGTGESDNSPTVIQASRNWQKSLSSRRHFGGGGSVRGGPSAGHLARREGIAGAGVDRKPGGASEENRGKPFCGLHRLIKHVSRLCQ